MRHELIRALNRVHGPLTRIRMSLIALFSPGLLIVIVFMSVSKTVGEMDDKQIEAFFGDE